MISPISPTVFFKKPAKITSEKSESITDAVTSEITDEKGLPVNNASEGESKQGEHGLLILSESGEVAQVEIGDKLPGQAQATQDTFISELADAPMSSLDALTTVETAAPTNTGMTAVTVNNAILANAVDVLADANIDIASPTVDVAAGLDVDTTPNQFVQSSDIAGLFYKSVLNFNTVGLDLVESTVLLLKSGWAYVGLRSSPLDVITPQADQTTSSQWAQWRNEEGDYQLKNLVGDWRSINGVKVDTKPLKPSEVAGNYSKIRSQNWGGTIFTNTENLTLSEQGEFMTSASNLVSSGGIGSQVPNTTIAIHTTDDSQGSSTVASAISGVASVFTDEDVIRRAGHRFGNYQLLDDGLTIEFQYADGTVKRELFFRMGTKIFAGKQSYLFERKSTNDQFASLYYTLSNSQEYVAENWLGEMAKAQEKHGKADAKSGKSSTLNVGSNSV